MSLVSIIIPSYNRPDVVQRAISSAVNQTYKNLQIIVVDDGSTVPYDIKLPAWYYKPWEENRGGSAARNYGLTQARGEFVVFLDDDNELAPEFVEKTLQAIEGEAAITTGRKIVYDYGEVEAVPTQTRYPAIDWGWLIRRSVFDKIRYDESIWGDEDADFGIQFVKRFSYKIIPDVLQTAYALSEQDATANTYPTRRRLQGLRNFLDKNLHEYIEPQERRYILRLAGRNYLRAGRYLTGVRYFWLSLMAQKNLKTFWHFFYAFFGWKTYDWYMTKEERK